MRMEITARRGGRAGNAKVTITGTEAAEVDDDALVIRVRPDRPAGQEVLIGCDTSAGDSTAPENVDYTRTVELLSFRVTIIDDEEDDGEQVRVDSSVSDGSAEIEDGVPVPPNLGLGGLVRGVLSRSGAGP